jgi:hypothetical protein
MSVLCAFNLCLCCYMCRKRPCDGLFLPPRSPTDCVWDQVTVKATMAQQRTNNNNNLVIRIINIIKYNLNFMTVVQRVGGNISTGDTDSSLPSRNSM